MSLYDYKASQRIASRDEPFYALIMAAMRKADSENTDILKEAYPEVWRELRQRYNAPGGCITEAELTALRETIEAEKAAAE